MKQRNIRKKRALDEQEELSEGEAEGAEGQPKLTADDIKLLQKQRQRRTVRLATAETRGVQPAWRLQAGSVCAAWGARSGASSCPCGPTRSRSASLRHPHC